MDKINNATMKEWKCQRGHVLGYVKWKGHSESQLHVLREAIDLVAETPAEPDVVAIMEGYVSATVKCSCCNAIRTWAPGSEALEKLIRSHQRMANHQRLDRLEMAL